MSAGLASALVVALSACTSSANHHNAVPKAPVGPSPFAVADPPPDNPTVGGAVGAAGGRFDSGTARAMVPAGAVPRGTTVHVVTAHAAGSRSGEIFGQPIGVEHSTPLRKPVTLTWSTTGVTARQLRTAVLAKWDPAAKVWRPSTVPLTVTGTTLTARVQHFSFWDWIANTGQTVGEVTGSRADAPKCNGQHLPGWVDSVVDTDTDTSAAAIRTCFEPDKNDVVTVRVVDNRTFAQQLVMSNGGQQWKWTYPGQQDYGASGAVYDAARAVFDTPTSFLLPPLSATAVGIARPAQPGSVVIAATAKVDWQTVLVDLVTFAFNQLTIGGTDNPLANAFLQAMFECGGKDLLHDRPSSALGIVQHVVGAIVGCATEINNPDSEFGARFQKLALAAIKKHPQSADTIAKAYRTIDEAGKAFKLLTVGQVAFYLSDQLANAAVGPLTLSIRGRGTPQQLGHWAPTCSNTKTDANALYKNLALQDAFADTSKELWQYPDWQPDAAVAVQPLTRCSAAYRGQLAQALPGRWGDKKAAAVVANEIRLLDQPTNQPAPQTSQAPPTQRAQASYTPGSAFDDSCVINWPTAPVYTSDSIQMVMGCAHVNEGQFFYTQVVYGDPNLRPTPNTGQMHVVGKVIDVATSAYGYRVLEVQASSITF